MRTKKKDTRESLLSFSHPEAAVGMMQTPQIIQPTVSAVLKLKFRVSELHLSEFVRILFLLTSLPLGSGL